MKVRVVVTREDVAKQQCHPYLGRGGHASAHDPHPPPYGSPGKILPRCTQQLGDGLLVETISLVPPLAILALLTLFQDQRVVHELVEGVCIKRNPLAPYP